MINVGVLLGLLLVTNFLSALVLAVGPSAVSRFHRITRLGSPEFDDTALLANYRGDRQRARKIFSDWAAVNDVTYIPFVEWKRNPYRGATATIAGDGDRETPQARAPGASDGRRPTVRFFGGSAMWGTGVDDGSTIPAFFARLHPEATVINHGERGLDSRQNLERLINLLDQGRRVDYVVFYEGVNDVAALCRVDTSLNGHGEEARMRHVLSNASTLQWLLFGRTAELLSHGAKLIFRQKTYACASDSARARRVASTMVRDWEVASTLARAGCARFLLVLQPNVFIGRPRVDQITRNSDVIPLTTFSELGDRLKAVYPLLQRMARQPGIGWLRDLTGVFDVGQMVYIDYAHVSANGNAIIARRISDLLPRRLSVQRRCRSRWA